MRIQIVTYDSGESKIIEGLALLHEAWTNFIRTCGGLTSCAIASATTSSTTMNYEELPYVRLSYFNIASRKAYIVVTGFLGP